MNPLILVVLLWTSGRGTWIIGHLILIYIRESATANAPLTINGAPSLPGGALVTHLPYTLPKYMHNTALKLHAHSVLYAHKVDALMKNPVALKVLVWSRGRLVTLQILTSSLFSLVEETHGSSGQCVSFSFIDVGSGFTAYVPFLFFSHMLLDLPCDVARLRLRAHILRIETVTWTHNTSPTCDLCNANDVQYSYVT